MEDFQRNQTVVEDHKKSKLQLISKKSTVIDSLKKTIRT